MEDYFTGFNLHCQGWISVYLDPSRPGFLGSSPISLNELLVQNTRWYLGLNQVAMSRFSPLVYGPLRMPTSQSMCYAEFAYSSLYFLALYVLALIPQLFLVRGISLYPEVVNNDQLIMPKILRRISDRFLLVDRFQVRISSCSRSFSSQPNSNTCKRSSHPGTQLSGRGRTSKECG